MRVEPFTCLRPTPERAASFAALPYDVFSEEEARSYVQAHPTSFLAIDRPEAGLAASQDATDPKAYAHARELLRERQLDFTLIRDEKPCYYLYELSAEGHRQTGLMAAASVDDYLSGTIHQHELTLPEKVADRVSHIEAVRAQTGPVCIAYRDSMALDLILGAAKQAEPVYDFASLDGVRHRVWRIARPAAVEAIGATFATIEDAYIADGHHRAAAAAAICRERRAQGREGDPAESFLCVLFPASQLRILPYDRLVSDVATGDEDELVGALEAAGLSCSGPLDAPVRPQRKGTFGMYAFGTWRELRWHGNADDLDVDVLQNRVLKPIFGIVDPRTDGRLSFTGGIEAVALARRAGEAGVAFTLFPTSMDELLAVADKGGLMPPKSTWFDPKPLSGLAIRRIW